VGQALWEDYGEQGLVVIGALVWASYEGPPTPEDAQLWCDLVGITHPVLADAEKSLEPDPVSYPTVRVIDRQMVVQVDDLSPYDPSVPVGLLGDE